MAKSAKRHEENSNIIKEIRASTDETIRSQGASIKTLEIQIGQISKVLQERGLGSLPSSTKTNPRDHVKSILTAKADLTGIRRIGSGPYAVSDSQISNTFSETVPFPRRLHDYCCDEWKEARELKILKTYLIGTTLHDNTLPQKEKDPGSFTLPCFIHNVCFDKALVDQEASVSVMPFSTYTNLGLGDLAHTRLTVELADRTIKHPRGIAENVLVRISKFIFPIDFIILDIPEDDDVPLILGRPFLSTAHAKIDVFKRKITLRVGEEKIVFKSIKPATSIIRRVYMLRMNLDSKIELIGEAVNKSFDPHYGDYIELNNLDVPLEPRINQDDNFKPTIDENVIDEGDHEGKDLARTLIDIPIFIGNFSIISGFTIIDDMDETSGVVLGMPFYKKFVSCQKIMEKFSRRVEMQYGISLGLGYDVLTPCTDLAVKKSTNWNNDLRNFDVHKTFKFGDFGISEWDELSVIIPKKKKKVVSKLTTSLRNEYERLKQIPGELGLNLSLLILEQDPSLPKRKRKAMELEPETYIAILHCRRELPEGVKFVNNLVIEQPKHGPFFIDAFCKEAFQRVNDVHKVETKTLLGYKGMASNVKTDANQRFSMLMSQMINERPNNDKIMSKRVKLESLGYTDV
ncbi:retrovirus-related pol polyprotein from transposon TNT 1-94 [Tanacetum coccineum]